MKKGANALYIGVLSPCHPFSQKILYMKKAQPITSRAFALVPENNLLPYSVW
jgi:hypothetical protein